MTDQCGNCTAKVNMSECFKLDCGHHETWYAKAKQAETEGLQRHVKRLNVAIAAAIDGLEANKMHAGVEYVRDYLKEAIESQ